MCTKSVRGALPSYTHHNKYLSLETNTIVLPFDHRVCFFTENPQEVKRSAIFTQERSQEGEKHVQNIICSQTQLDSIVHEQTIICGQLLICRSRGGLSANETKEKFASNDNNF